MMLADAGADIIRIDRPDATSTTPPKSDVLNRGRRSVVVDLKRPHGVELVLRLVESANGITEGFRPGVAEKLGLGPTICLQRNPRLVYGRMTGYGQAGPMASAAGHDIDCIALSGVLDQMGREGERPVPPLNVVGDFGGGGMLLAFGMCAALINSLLTGVGQVVDTAMVDGAASLMAMVCSMREAGTWADERGTNLLDTGAHFYEVYETADGHYMAVGAIEPKFYAQLLTGLEIEVEDLPDQMDRSSWVAMKRKFTGIFASKSKAEWEERFKGSDACVVPVLSISEAARHPHNEYRQTYTEIDGVLQPSPSPRFDKTASTVRRPSPSPGEGCDEVLQEWGIESEEIFQLRKTGAIIPSSL
jgi:alpha-methylacyl-CoA racemase